MGGNFNAWQPSHIESPSSYDPISIGFSLGPTFVFEVWNSFCEKPIFFEEADGLKYGSHGYYLNYAMNPEGFSPSPFNFFAGYTQNYLTAASASGSISSTDATEQFFKLDFSSFVVTNAPIGQILLNVIFDAVFNKYDFDDIVSTKVSVDIAGQGIEFVNIQEIDGKALDGLVYNHELETNVEYEIVARLTDGSDNPVAWI